MALSMRKKKLSNSRLQLGLVAIFAFLSCVAALFQVLLTNRALISLSGKLQTDGDIVMAALPGILTGNIVWTMTVLVPLMTIVGILVTHRIAGPVYRFERHLEAIARGEDPGPCRIRKEDELHELCDRINAAVTALRGQAGDDTADEGDRTEDTRTAA